VAQPQIHVLLDDPVVPPEIAAALRRIDAGVRLSRLDSELLHPTNVPADARLVITSERPNGGGRQLQALCQRWGRATCATLVLTPGPVEDNGVTLSGDAPLIGFASGLSAEELAGRLATMCTFQQPLSRLHNELAELRRRNQAEFPRDALDEQLRLAGKLQRDLLPNPLTRIDGAVLHTLYRPADCVSGDTYDVARLDEDHVSLFCADATGHGVPAALLTMFVRRALRGKEVYQGAYRILPPDEVLENLNHEMFAADLTECQFVSGLYAVYEEETRELCWARAGAPLPILVRPGQPPRRLDSTGLLLGVEPFALFERAERTLEPGDVVLFCTDGLEALLVEGLGRGTIHEVDQTSWYASLGEGNIADRLAELTDLLDGTPRNDWPVDDLTVLALEII